MAYATLDDLVARFGEQELIDQTDRVSGTNVNTEVVTRVLDDASAILDGYLAGRYALPLATVPALLVGLCCDLARYALYPDAAPDLVKERYQNALKLLARIADGTLQLGLSGPPAQAGLSQVVSSPRLFARGERS